jgi:pimeloyl-ACP methyl ester carboxylesterase/DNA-binding CsgD family transcriptional regulator
MTSSQSEQIGPHNVVDHLYEIALDPQSLDAFIQAWTSTGLDQTAARQAMRSIDRFDEAYKTHLDRAARFQKRDPGPTEPTDLTQILTAFDGLAAFVVGANLTVAAANDGARVALGIGAGSSLRQMSLPDDLIDTLQDELTQIQRAQGRRNTLLKFHLAQAASPTLFQLHRLDETQPTDRPMILVVSTHSHWQIALDDTLSDLFNLTAAERDVARALTEGHSAKAIAQQRQTSEGTVRGQIKTIFSKMNARNQSEVIRLVLSLRDMSRVQAQGTPPTARLDLIATEDWLLAEVWKPFHSLTLHDGRNLDYHIMGPATGKPVLYSHMGYCMVRWHKPMLRLAYKHNLRVICPIRAGYGNSDNIDSKQDVIKATREDTYALLQHLGIARLPYVVQGNDLLFAADFAAHHPDRISEIIGICARPPLQNESQFTHMGKWHRFFFSTAKHAPHLMTFTIKAGLALARRIGVAEVYRLMNQSSAADMSHFQDEEIKPVMTANAELIASKTTDVSQAFTMEICATESDWSAKMHAIRDVKTWFINGAEDPSCHVEMIADYRAAYPWIDIEVLPDAGQMLIYQHYEKVIPRLAEAAHRAQPQSTQDHPSQS